MTSNTSIHIQCCCIFWAISQEALLKALRKVCTHVKMATLITSTATSTSSLPSPIIITTALLTQCRKKQDHTYQAAAMETLGGVASTLEVDVFAEFSKISFPVLLPVRISLMASPCQHIMLCMCPCVCVWVGE